MTPVAGPSPMLATAIVKASGSPISVCRWAPTSTRRSGHVHLLRAEASALNPTVAPLPISPRLVGARGELAAERSAARRAGERRRRLRSANSAAAVWRGAAEALVEHVRRRGGQATLQRVALASVALAAGGASAAKTCGRKCAWFW